MINILILGSTGMLGHMLYRVLSKEKDWNVTGTNSREFDVEKYEDSTSFLSEKQKNLSSYDYIINCIGILAPVENNEQAIRVNALFPQILARLVQGKIIHISTDGVFSGRRGPYKESDPHDCEDIYGKTKSLGEVVADGVLNIRTSIIGPSPHKRKGLFEWFFAQEAGAQIDGYTNHIWNGVTTLEFAELCKYIIQENIFNTLREESYVFHFAPHDPVTKHELLTIFRDVFDRNIRIRPVEAKKSSPTRILHTQYGGLKRIFPHGQSLRASVEKLSQYV